MATSTIAARNTTWDHVNVPCYFADITTGTPAAYTYVPCRGELVGFKLTQYATTATTNTVITPNVNGTAVVGGAITVVATGDAAGDVTSVFLSPGTTINVNEGDYIGYTSDGGADDATVPAIVQATIRLRRN